MTRFLNAYVALERMAMDADDDGDGSFSEVARDQLGAFWDGMSDEERAEMRARVLAACCRCRTSLLVAPLDPANMMAMTYSCAACAKPEPPAEKGRHTWVWTGSPSRRSPA